MTAEAAAAATEVRQEMKVFCRGLGKISAAYEVSKYSMKAYDLSEREGMSFYLSFVRANIDLNDRYKAREEQPETLAPLQEPKAEKRSPALTKALQMM